VALFSDKTLKKLKTVYNTVLKMLKMQIIDQDAFKFVPIQIFVSDYRRPVQKLEV